MMTVPPQGTDSRRGILIGAVLALVLNICDTYSASIRHFSECC